MECGIVNGKIVEPKAQYGTMGQIYLAFLRLLVAILKCYIINCA